ncbi:MAG: P-loop ATPase, Sll1717 family [bacterium]
MIINLPEKITLKDLHDIDFGNIEANDDKLLFDSVCKTTSILEFLSGKKNIVLGEKGTGKTALFRLINQGKLKLAQNHEYKNVIIPIEDNFQYKNIKGKVLRLIKTDIEEVDFKYQVVWELFLFYRCLRKLQELNIETSQTLKKAIQLTDNIFSKNGIDEFLKSKKTFGVKLYDTATTILPDFYLTTEPVAVEDETNLKNKSVESLDIDLDVYKQELNDFLIQNKLNFVVLIDRLDEFVSKNSIETQIDMLEALISVEREYGRYSNIELKIFLRDDLFKQLNYDGIGYDKVIAKKLDLIWNPAKIREFIAKRIYNNFKVIFKMESLILDISNEKIELDTSIDTDDFVKPKIHVRLYRYLLKKWKPKQYALKHPRKVNLNDNLNKEIILSLLPRYVGFKNGNGKVSDIEIFDFFSQKFNLGTGNTIPRLIILFFQKLLLVTKTYYTENSDQLPIYLNEQKCFEIIKKGFFVDAYEQFKNEIYLNFSKLNPEFEDKILLFKERIGNRYSFSAKDLKGILDFKDNAELYHFCKYLLHIGVLKRTNNTTTVENMKFILPEIFRTTK